jgi:hypothetical protein
VNCQQVHLAKSNGEAIAWGKVFLILQEFGGPKFGKVSLSRLILSVDTELILTIA